MYLILIKKKYLIQSISENYEESSRRTKEGDEEKTKLLLEIYDSTSRAEEIATSTGLICKSAFLLLQLARYLNRGGVDCARHVNFINLNMTQS
jgi:hypothetical protein